MVLNLTKLCQLMGAPLYVCRVAAVGTGSDSETVKSYAQENLDIFNFTLTADEVQDINQLYVPSFTWQIKLTAGGICLVVHCSAAAAAATDCRCHCHVIESAPV